MARPGDQLDVLVLGEHPATYLAASLLAAGSKRSSRSAQPAIGVLHATLPGSNAPDRLVLVNSRLFSLHKLIEPLRRRLDLTGVYGLQFLSDAPGVGSEHRSRSAMGWVGSYKDVRNEMIRLAAAQGVEMASPRTFQIHGVDETGADVSLGSTRLHPRMLLVGTELPRDQRRMLGIPDQWAEDVLYRFRFVQFKAGDRLDLGGRPTLPMSLDLKGTLSWGWAMVHDGRAQLAVAEPIRSNHDDLLEHWMEVLRGRELLKGRVTASPESIDLPLAGALAHEGVANRTLLIGPAGGFYSASGEDIYPNCWSALFAVETIRKALKEPHLQDALQSYRHRWRTTLGDYLRGPQQNLRFLLPLVYRNEVMTTRLAESILLGRSVVR